VNYTFFKPSGSVRELVSYFAVSFVQTHWCYVWCNRFQDCACQRLYQSVAGSRSNSRIIGSCLLILGQGLLLNQKLSDVIMAWDSDSVDIPRVPLLQPFSMETMLSSVHGHMTARSVFSRRE